MRNNKEVRGKRGQVTIFIIIAIVLVIGIVLFFTFRDRIFQERIPQELAPVFDYFESCIEETTKQAALEMGSKGGYLELPEFSPGSEYAPFSSQLDFHGQAVPYWYYISGNGIKEEQIPSQKLMENQLENYLNDKIKDCKFYEFEERGFNVLMGDSIETEVSIKDNNIDVSVDFPLGVYFNEISSRKTKHEIVVRSNLGSFYNLAREIYSKQEKDAFLENYALDVLRLYAPVDGVEFSCTPKVWMQQDIKQELKQALEANMQAIKIQGNYYTLSDEENQYFVQSLGEEIGKKGEAVNFLYSGNWPTKVEIYPNENPMIASPVGPEHGLGALGFCYVTYHYVYDLSVPVLIQIYNSEGEIFQFPVAVVIDKNKPREGLLAEEVFDTEDELCEYREQEISVYTYDLNLDPVEADISFECLGQRCSIGRTENTDGEAILEGEFPGCVNGYIVAQAEGYSRKRHLYSTNEEGIADIVLDKLYNLSVDLKVDATTTDEQAIVVFSSLENTQTIVWPEQKQLKLSEGEYDIEIYIYRDSKIILPATKTEKCAEVPKSGLAGFLGMTEEKCFTIDLPAEEIEGAIYAGGKSTDYFIESQLQGGSIEIDVESLPMPTGIESLQENYNLLETKPVYIYFKE